MVRPTVSGGAMALARVCRVDEREKRTSVSLFRVLSEL